MKVCFPVITDAGLTSQIYGHFASAPRFLIIDTKTGESAALDNCDSENPFVGCNPFSALSRQSLDGIVVGSIGDDAVRAMNLCGFRIYQADTASVARNIELIESGGLTEVTILQSHLEGRCSAGESGHVCKH